MTNWKNRWMAFCALVMVTVSFWMGIHYVAGKILINKLHLTSPWIQTWFAPQNMDHDHDAALKRVSIDWRKEYPFQALEEDTSFNFDAFQKKLQAKLKEKGDTYAERHLLGYFGVVEQGRRVERVVDWNIAGPEMNIMRLSDGYLTYVCLKRQEESFLAQRADAVKALSDAAERMSAKFFFVQAPFKVSPYGDEDIRDRFDFSNENASRLLEAMRERGVATIDLRTHAADFSETEYHQQFFKTDHHWKPQTALRAAHDLEDVFRTQCGVYTDTSRLHEDDFEWHVKKDCYLGSQGQKLTLAREEPEDFVWMEPKYPSELRMQTPDLDLDITGPFKAMLNLHQLDDADIYTMTRYRVYAYGDCAVMRYDNLEMADAQDQKIMMLSDSFGDAIVPFLAMGAKHVIKVDKRYFNGSVETLIEKERPDVVFVLYTTHYFETPIQWSKHTDQFDFR